ncbi:MAG: TonB-dependent receptor, partial [Gemmatimonadales bacterium]|nr:TonB-dependent receptor [Gemmatimonadales bacterium]
VEFGRRFSPGVEGKLLYTRYHIDGGFDDRQDHPGDTLGFAFARHRSFNILRQSVDARLDVLALPSVMITAGAIVDLDREQLNGEASSNFGSGPEATSSTPFDEDRRNLSSYVQALIDLSLPLSLHLGARLDDNDAFGSFFTYRAGAVYRLSSDLRIRASLGTGFKAPTFAENFANEPFEVGNPDLDPERSISWEVGAEHTMWGGSFAVWANYFDQRFRDLVQYSFAEPGLPNYDNLPQALARGIETGVSLVPRAGITVTGQYTYLDTETTDPGADGSPGTAFELGQPLVRRPAHALRVAGSVRLAGRATLGLNLNHVGSRDDLAFEDFTAVRVRLPGYTTLEVSAMVDVLRPRPGHPGVTATLRVENALDEEYDTVVGFQGRGRVASLGARVRF